MYTKTCDLIFYSVDVFFSFCEIMYCLLLFYMTCVFIDITRSHRLLQIFRNLHHFFVYSIKYPIRNCYCILLTVVSRTHSYDCILLASAYLVAFLNKYKLFSFKINIFRVSLIFLNKSNKLFQVVKSWSMWWQSIYYYQI